jgi:hypothetical protein
MMTEIECMNIVRPIVEDIVNRMAKNDYDGMADLVANPRADLDDLADWVRSFLEMNELNGIDVYGAPCDFHPQYEYHQLRVYPYDDASGFAAEYDLTTDGELNDLILQMDCKLQSDGAYAVSVGVDV